MGLREHSMSEEFFTLELTKLNDQRSAKEGTVRLDKRATFSHKGENLKLAFSVTGSPEIVDLFLGSFNINDVKQFITLKLATYVNPQTSLTEHMDT